MFYRIILQNKKLNKEVIKDFNFERNVDKEILGNILYEMKKIIDKDVDDSLFIKE